MGQIISSTKTTSIVIIQGAFDEYCASEAGKVFESWQLDGYALPMVELEQAVATTQENWLKFQGLVAAWRTQRGIMSSVTESVLCPAYQSILGMGPEAIPFLLRQLANEGDDPDQWFWALKAITGADPVNEDDRGNNLLMARSWFEWGIERGYAW